MKASCTNSNVQEYTSENETSISQVNFKGEHFIPGVGYALSLKDLRSGDEGRALPKLNVLDKIKLFGFTGYHLISTPLVALGIIYGPYQFVKVVHFGLEKIINNV